MAEERRKRRRRFDSKGVLIVQKPYLRIPYSLLRAEDFVDLDPLSTKIFILFLRQWMTHKPDEPVEVSYSTIKKRCRRTIRDRSCEGVKFKRVQPGNSQVARAIGQLEQYGFIRKETQLKQCNRYFIEWRWFTGHYP